MTTENRSQTEQFDLHCRNRFSWPLSPPGVLVIAGMAVLIMMIAGIGSEARAAVINGTVGDDVLIGTAGGDIIHGLEGSDTLYGNGGDDILYGDAGSELLYGGEGADRFVISASDVGTGIDSVRDFNVAEGDTLDISDILTNYDPATSATEDFVHITEVGVTSVIAVDADGGGDSFTTIALAVGTTGLTDVQALVDDGTLILVGSNTAPTAVAGADQSIHAGNTVYLDGSGSFDDNTASTALIYSWSFSEKPAASSATLLDANTATPTFFADLDGNYIVQLVVTDEGGLSSDPDEVLISSNNQAPTANATATTVLPVVGFPVNLDGTGSTDPDMDAITYDWTVTSRPAGSTAAIVNADSALASFVPDVAGEYEVTLNVSDFLGAGTPATLTFVASSASSYAEQQILSAADTLEGLSSSQVTTKGNQNALGNFLSQAVKQLQDGDVAGAIDKLNQAIERTDGCALRGAPDGNGPGRDWVTDCVAQQQIYDNLTASLTALEN